MKIAFSAMGEDLECMLDPRFGRCSRFIIIDSDTFETKEMVNPAMATAHGAGTMAAQKVLEAKPDAIVTGHIGPNAYAVLHAAGIKIYTCVGTTLSQAMELLKQNKLKEISSPGPGHGGRP